MSLLLLIALACVPALVGWSVFWFLLLLISTFWGAIILTGLVIALLEVQRLKKELEKPGDGL